MEKELVISKKSVEELEQMFEEKGYSKFALHDASRHVTHEGRLGEVLMEYIENSPSDNLLPEVECVSSWRSSENEFTALSFIIDIRSGSGPDVLEMAIRKHAQHLSVGKSCTIKNIDDIPAMQRASKEADQLFRYVSRLKNGIKIRG